MRKDHLRATPNDFEVGKRHNLPKINIMNDDAINELGGKYAGMDRHEARKSRR